jgi:uncharacterized protein YndB with AHSA1/START domain
VFQPNPDVIEWRLHFKSSPARVYEFLATDEGRAKFWAESAIEKDGALDFVFPNGWTWHGPILERIPNQKYTVEYFGHSITTFELEDDGEGGTDLRLTDANVPADDRNEVIAGWVSVLMQLKAAVDFGVDLRNHDAKRTWDQGFVEN